ncbi:unnamed protein product [Darwinula stevensoni]|uniref:Glycerol-3-phosphate dehydrogenase n=1 Tax=Darwinula stevensoni TaxID=69355 RepID=A0A7R8ZZB4_9CRUS|nr:unnamed protein product [Darwinula stevensoni]CAG0882210.1 unnamed protein product [Darwinula stevensoni]
MASWGSKMSSHRFGKYLLRGLIMSGGAAGLGIWWLKREADSIVDALPRVMAENPLNSIEHRLKHLPTREELLQKLKTEEFDVLVVGGGCTGCGVALDAVSRGLKTALVEREDYSSGTSSRSTKLIHGGVRYLQKAILGFDREQYKIVQEALHERANLLAIAPHLSFPLPIMLPIYKWWQVPYFYAGIKLYDIVSGSKLLKSSYYLSKKKALELFPVLKKDALVGALVYYDGSHNDSRMNLTIALTAIRLGAVASNYVTVEGVLKAMAEDGKEYVSGAKVKDELTGETWEVKAKCVINATGPFCDSLRKMDDPTAKSIVQPSMGIHVVLPNYYSPEQMGLLDPSTTDGRVIFFLPWQRHTIAGTTDSPCSLTYHPAPTENDIQFILNEIRNYLNADIEVRRGDVLSAWSGIRPLVFNPAKSDTQSIARNHIVHVSDSGLVTIAGGKWTTYRKMAKDTMDVAVKAFALNSKNDSLTDGLLLDGAHSWSPTMFIRLVQDIGMETDVAIHLANTYGDQAFQVAKLSKFTGKRWPIMGRKIHEDFPYIEGEVQYAIREYARTVTDIIARRLRFAFLNVQAAEEALPLVADIMAEELKWDEKEKSKQIAEARQFLRLDMGGAVNKASVENMAINLTRDQMSKYIARFQQLDSDRKGFITINDFRDIMKKEGKKVSEKDLHMILSEIDLHKNGRVELPEFLLMMAAFKTGTAGISGMTRSLLLDAEPDGLDRSLKAVERSGGGV